MRRLLPILLVLLPLPLIGCGSGGGGADSEATLRKELGGPPSIQPGRHHPGPANKAKLDAEAAATSAGQATAGTAGTGGTTPPTTK